MPSPKIYSVAYWALVVVSVFNALSAIGGGIAILATDGAGMPDSFLEQGPFTSFVVPGLILLLVVGGTQTLSAVLLILRKESSLLWTSVAGVGMVIWIFVEIGIIAGFSWLQVLYFVTGGAQIVAVNALLGVAEWMPRRPLRPATDATKQGSI
jgi:hypothetical protein